MLLKEMESLLRSSLELQHITLEDQSYFHRNHKQNQGNGSHYHVTLVSKEFEGQATLSIHRKVYQALNMPENPDIHALSIQTFTPTQWEEKSL